MITDIVTSTPDLVMLVIGIFLLNMIYHPKYCESIDFLCAIFCTGYLYLLAVWAMVLNYGVEII